MMRILFICHGNICRSPMAEFVFRDMVRKHGLADNFEIASAAVSSEEEGNSVYPPVKRLLNAAGIDCSGKTARKMTRADYEYYDLLLEMDHSNLRNMSRIWLTAEMLTPVCSRLPRRQPIKRSALQKPRALPQIFSYRLLPFIFYSYVFSISQPFLFVKEKTLTQGGSRWTHLR